MNRLLVVTLAAVVAIELLGYTATANAAKDPVITSISPSSVIAGGPGFTLTVNGSGFNGNSYVLWNGAQRPTVTINNSQLQAFISNADIATAGTVQVTVVDPKPFPQQSNPTSLTINSVPLTITTASLPTAAVQRPYSAAVTNSGGVAPYTWKIASGQLPPGLALDSTSGAISGTPGQSGKYAFTAQVSDSSSTPQTASQTLAVNVIATSLLIGTTTLPSGTLQVPYSSILTATGGTTPYSWSVVSGALPPGLVLNASTGTIAGTPSASGQYSFTVQVTDSGAQPQSATKAFSISIAALAPAPLQITTTSLPGGGVGVNYSATLVAANGVPPYTWSITGGQLPPGLALQASPGQISGNPTQAGTFGFLVQVKDSSGQATSTNLSVVIALLPAPTVGSVSPNSGPAAGGTSVTISGTNFQAGASVLFGGVAALSAAVTNATQIQAITPAHAAGTVDVTVRNPDGQSSTLSSSFVYNNPAPIVSSVSPNTGPAAGGTSVSITGTNFLAGALVLFGAAPASAVTVSSATQIQAVTPASAAGTVDVIVQNSDGQTAKLTGGFTYTAPAPVGSPTITGVSPNSGAPGTQVTINGTNFGSGATVAFGGTNSTSTAFVSATQLSASVPPIAAGVVDVKVTNSSGSSATLPGGFTVTKAQSLLTGMTPSNFTVPSGWTLVLTQDFESGSIGPNEYIVGGATITSVNPHSGTKSLANRVTFDSGGVQWGILQGVIGTSRHIYLSYWRYFDSNACGGVEIYFDNVYTNSRSGIFNVMDTDNYTGTTCSNNLTTAFYSSSSSPSLDPNFDHNGGPYNLSSAQGKWEQVEFEFQGNVSSSTDSIVRLYINGVKIYEELNTNVNGSISAVGMAVEAGPLFTYIALDGVTRIAPPNGAFNVYIDDIILLKQ